MAPARAVVILTKPGYPFAFARFQPVCCMQVHLLIVPLSKKWFQLKFLAAASRGELVFCGNAMHCWNSALKLNNNARSTLMPKTYRHNSRTILSCTQGMSSSSKVLGLRPCSCDTFVALPPATVDGSVIFGKNSDRQSEEVQEVVVYPGGQHPVGTSLQCTYISIPQAKQTYAVVLSKPSWMWGAEMGANECGVVCGNEAVWTVEDDAGPAALLGMDLVRLSLERGTTSSEAVDIIASLMEQHGQGGGCEEGGSWTYHNSFLVADATEAWVVETAGRHWAAQRITQGVRNISNCLSIRTDFQRCSKGLQEYARLQGYWDGKGEFDFAAAFSEGGAPPLGQLSPGREANGYRLLQRAGTSMDPAAMMAILRDRASGICMCDGAFRSNGSQVSRLMKASQGEGGSSDAAQHWFTATPDPMRSVFKPFSFLTHSPGTSADASQQNPPQQAASQQLCASTYTQSTPAPRNPPHPLWQAWESVYESGVGFKPPLKELRDLERRGLEPNTGLTFSDAVEEEMRMYKKQ